MTPLAFENDLETQGDSMLELDYSARTTGVKVGTYR